MVESIKINGMAELSSALVKMKKGTLPAVTSNDNGKILTASYDAAAGGSASWQDAPESVPAVTSSDGGKVLTSHYNAETGVGSMSWDEQSAPVSLVIDDNGTLNHIGDFREHTADSVIVHPIVSKYISASGTWGYTNNYGPTFKLSDCYKIISVTVFGTWTYGAVIEKVNAFYDPNEDGGTWKTYRTGNAISDISVSGVLIEYAQTVS